MLIIRLFIVVLAGIAAHRAYEPTRVFGVRWGSLVRYAIGILLFIPAQLVVKAGMPKKPDGVVGLWDETERDIAAGLLAAGATGTGVLLGHIMDAQDK